MPAKKKNIDWNAVKNEYISNPAATFHSLSCEFEISASAIHRRAKEGGWAEKREHFENKTEKETLDKLIAERARSEVKRFKKLYDATDRLTRKVEQAISKVDPRNTLAIRQLASTLKELRVMEGIDKPMITDSDEGGVIILPEIKAPERPESGKDAESSDKHGISEELREEKDTDDVD